jgi:hypothetical protein
MRSVLRARLAHDCSASVIYRPQQALARRHREHRLESARLTERVNKTLDVADDSIEIFDPLAGQKPAIDWEEHGERAHDTGDNAEEVEAECEHAQYIGGGGYDLGMGAAFGRRGTSVLSSAPPGGASQCSHLDQRRQNSPPGCSPGRQQCMHSRRN